MKTKRSIRVAIIACVILSIGACKKTSTTPTGGGSGATNSTNYSGTLESEMEVFHSSSAPNDTLYSANATFYLSPQSSWNYYSPANLISAGNVSIDSVQLKPQYSLYSDTSNSLKLATKVNWKVSGSTNIPSFTYTPVISWPTYSGGNLLPDTIHLSQSNTIQLSGISGADSVGINLFDGSTIKQTHNYASNTTSIQIPQSMTTSLSANNNATIQISIYKFIPVQTFGSKKFLFVFNYGYTQYVVIK